MKGTVNHLREGGIVLGLKCQLHLNIANLGQMMWHCPLCQLVPDVPSHQMAVSGTWTSASSFAGKSRSFSHTGT